MKTEIYELNKDSLTYAKKILRSGGLVAFPTETVYGLGANALNGKAVKSIFTAKGRPQDNPLIVHLSHVDKIKKYVKKITKTEQKIINAFMPGPITLVLRKKRKISNVVTAGLDTVGIRIPSNHEAHEFLKAVNLPIAAPSANTSKRPSPTNATDVYEDMQGKIPLIINGGDTEVGVESTVVKVVNETVLILRPGKVTAEDFKREIGCEVIDKTLIKDGEKPESPGAKYTHYAPKCKMTLVIKNPNDNVVEKCTNLYNKLKEENFNPVVLCSQQNSSKYAGKNFIIIGKNSNEACNAIFSTLRSAEKNYDYIICEFVSGGTMEDALYNRLLKSCSGDII